MFTIDRVQREKRRTVLTFTAVTTCGNVMRGPVSPPVVEVVPETTVPTRRQYATEAAALAARDALLASRRWGADKLVVRPLTRS